MTAAAAAASSTVATSGERIVPSVCLMCPSGCGMWGRVVDGRLVKLEGNPLHPVNLGIVPQRPGGPNCSTTRTASRAPCAGSAHAAKGIGSPSPGRRRCRWSHSGSPTLRADGHPERLAFLYGETRGQMRDLITRFTQAIGSPNAISHDSLNIEAAKLGNLLTQGIYDLLAYDLENANYLLSFGAGLLEAGRTRAAVHRGLRVHAPWPAEARQGRRCRPAPGHHRGQG